MGIRLVLVWLSWAVIFEIEGHMSKPTKLLLRITIVTGLVLPISCGTRDLSTKDTVTVHGRAILHGEPIRYAQVDFTPADDNGMPASGRTDGDGYFQLWTYGNEGPDGAVPGRYLVDFSAGAAIPSGGLPKGGPGPSELPPDLGEITVEIPSAGGDIEIVIP
jgi:hypothetical protein